MIDRENVIGNLEQNIRWIEEIECHQFPGWGNVTMSMRDAVELLKEQPEVVHCKDCKHSCDYSAMYAVRPYRCEKHSGFREADWFCADGERQGDNE